MLARLEPVADDPDPKQRSVVIITLAAPGAATPGVARWTTADGRSVTRPLPTALLRWLGTLRDDVELASPPAVALAPREYEVLMLLASGRSYKQIADDLSISVGTVRTYIRALYRKLDVHSATEAIACARRQGLV